MKYQYKCFEKDCSRMIESDNLDNPILYCSFECACYDGVFSVSQGIIDQEKINKHKKELYAVLADK